MGQIAIPSSTASSASNIVKYLKVGTSGGTIYMGEVRVFPSDEDISNMTTKALTLVAWEDTTFTFTPSSSQTLSYSTDDGTTWSTLPSTGIAVSAGQEVRFSGTCVPVASSSTVTAETNWGIGRFSSDGKYHVEGNVMSLLGSGWATNKSLQNKSWAFFGLFSGSTTLMSAEYLLLPATKLYSYCYRHMFVGCTNLTIGPELPSLEMYTQCYYGMFQGCSKLVATPKLPSTTLASHCYRCMFRYCTSLVNAPELPAETMVQSCYQSMFEGCKNLVNAPELPATTLAVYCYEYMFRGCTNLVKVQSVLPAEKVNGSGYCGMFQGCENITEAPEILATSGGASAFKDMFNQCSKLNKIKCLSKNPNANIMTAWTRSVAASGTFIKDASVTRWTSGANGIPTGWTVINNYGNKKYPLTFIARENCTFKFTPRRNSGGDPYYSTDEGNTWSVITTNGVTVQAGSTVMWKGTCVDTGGGSIADSGIGSFTSTGKFDIEGNIMSLLYDDNFSGQTALKGRSFCNLFSGNTNVVNTENLILPATSTTNCAYSYMFGGCTSLVTTPELIATTHGTWSYYGMFSGCTSLTTAPDLIATSIPGNAYGLMFRNCTSLVKPPKIYATGMTAGSTGNCATMFAGCTSLTEAPVLLVKTLQPSAYNGMFSGCTNLKYVKCLATDISASNCTTGWMTGVASQGIFVKDQTMTGWTRGANGIPTNWKDSDYLTFVALEDDVKFRFNYPISYESTNKLSYSINGGEWVDGLASTIYTPPLKKGDKIRWKGNISAYVNGGSGTFESNGRFDAEGNVMSLMYGDNYETQTSLDSMIFQSLFENSKIVNANNLLLPSTTLKYYCYRYMFRGCTLLTTAPALPAITLTTACYYGMFSGCTNLNYIKAMFTTTPNTTDTRDWVKGVAATGTFVKNSAATWTTTGNNGVPTGWTVQTETP